MKTESIQLTPEIFIGKKKPAFLIAEIGNNHNGVLADAKKLVDAAIEAGADAVKFQHRNMDELYGSAHTTKVNAADLGAQYTLDLLKKFQLTDREMAELFAYCRSKKYLAFCTPWDKKSLAFLEEINCPFYKVASADLTNHDLLEELANTRKPLIISTGMALEKEIEESVALLNRLQVNFALLHCNSTYPTPFKDVNLRYMQQLKKYTTVIGYSGHERGFHVPIAAVALGANIVEKHFTFDKNLEGVDHRVSLLPAEFAAMSRQIRDVESSLGTGESLVRTMSQGETINRENLGKSVVAARNLATGHIIDLSDLSIRSPGQGLAPYHKKTLVGSKLRRDISEGECFYPSDLPSGQMIKARAYQFKRPWGIPVRHHDVKQIVQNSRPDFIEFHLSYKDMNLRHQDFIEKDNDLQFTVHAPELFEGDHICNLVAKDKRYLQASIDNMKRVIEIAVELKQFYPSTKRPFIVATLGGFTTDRPLTREERMPLYDMMRESLAKIETPEVEILPQSTAPFPWHMGGQQYQNLFLYADEIESFCKTHDYRICLDISHSYLGINELKLDPKHFFETVAPWSAHLHIGDCKGVDGEGLQIGDGEIDFKWLGEIFARKAPKAWFIPEIWQGHKNGGEGFWLALERLEGLL